MNEAAKPAKKRKAAAAAAAAASPVAGKKKLAAGIGSLLARLEASNATFLQAAAADAVATQLAKVKAAPLVPAATSSPSLRSLPVDHAELARRAERRQRFQEEKAAAAAAAGIKDKDKTLVALRSEHGVARGQNTSLEKEYLRLTSLPSAADVRPPEVLAQALELLKRRWTAGWQYKEACSQLKAIRQDLTVQHVRSRLTVQVYETHARIAIEVGDWAEFRQCHSVLRQLYAEGLQGCQAEFEAYGLLLAAAAGRNVLAHELTAAASAGAIGASSSSGGGQAAAAGGERPAAGAGGAAAEGGNQERFVGHALAVCRAYLAADCVRFLRLYDGAPRMAPYLMDALLAKMRGMAYSTVLAAFQSSVPLSALSTWFGFSQKKEAAAFLRERGAVVAQGCLDIKASRAALALLQQQQAEAAGQQDVLPRR